MYHHPRRTTLLRCSSSGACAKDVHVLPATGVRSLSPCSLLRFLARQPRAALHPLEIAGAALWLDAITAKLPPTHNAAKHLLTALQRYRSGFSATRNYFFEWCIWVKPLLSRKVLAGLVSDSLGDDLYRSVSGSHRQPMTEEQSSARAATSPLLNASVSAFP
jgi:hypothetical protein